MKIIAAGHIYELHSIDGEQKNTLVFVNREPGRRHPGTQTQEVLRALIDRTWHCHNCLPHEINLKIIHHLRMALVLHEARALERMVEKGELEPEQIAIDIHDGHYTLTSISYENEAPHAPTDNPYPRQCSYLP